MKSSPCLSCNHYANANFNGESWNRCTYFRKDMRNLAVDCNVWQRSYGLNFDDMLKIYTQIEIEKRAGI